MTVSASGAFTPEQLAERTTGVGASEVAAIMGLSDYETALDVYLRKVGLAGPSSDSEAKRLGRALEPVVLGLYEEETGVRVVPSATLRNPAYPRLFATPDGLWPGAARGVEAKTVAGRYARKWGTPGTDEIPVGYLLQAMAQMMAGGFRAVDVPVLIAGQRFAVYHVDYSDDIAATIEEAVARFWRDYVERAVAPPSPDPDAVARYLALANPRAEREVERATEEIDALAWQYREAKRAHAGAEEDLRRCENALKEAIGDRQGFESDAYRVTWTEVRERRSPDYEQIVARMGITVPEEVAAECVRTRRGYRLFRFSDFATEGE